MDEKPDTSIRISRTEIITVPGLGLRIRVARRESGQTVTALAAAAGISSSRWMQLESGAVASVLPESRLRAIERALGVDFGVRFDSEPEDERSEPDDDESSPGSAPLEASREELVQKVRELAAEGKTRNEMRRALRIGSDRLAALRSEAGLPVRRARRRREADGQGS